METVSLDAWLKSSDSKPHAIIQGNNIDILRQLHKQYDATVSCIYIDVPYNNGEKYSYYNDRISHNKWLEQIKAVLSELQPYLCNDGSLWISIDDKEMHYLKVLCDEVFGRNSFITTIVWQQRNTRENRKIFSNNHEYILVYSPDPKAFKKKRNLIPITEDVLARYANPDNDPRGPWQSVSANAQAGHASASQFYEIIAPNGKHHNPPQGRCWVYGKDRMNAEIEAGNIWFGNDGNGVPRLKKFLSDKKLGLVPETLWLSSFVGTNAEAKQHLKKLHIEDNELFDTPKPETLIAQIIEIATNKGDLVMDAYLGSGTTVAAAHKLGRNYIGIEKEEKAFNYVLKRMEQVVNGESGGISRKVNWEGGGNYQAIPNPKQ